MEFPSIATLQSDLDCTVEQAQTALGIIHAGYQHGLAGWYRDNDYSSDADWCYGVGDTIRTLETALDIDDGTIGDLYTDAHGTGLFERYNDGKLITLIAENSGDDPFQVMLHAYHDEATEWADAQKYIGGDSFECEGGFCYAIVYWHPTIVADIKAEGFVVDWSSYGKPSGEDYAVVSLLDNGAPCEGGDFGDARRVVKQWRNDHGAVVITYDGKAYLWHAFHDGTEFDTVDAAVAFAREHGFDGTPFVWGAS